MRRGWTSAVPEDGTERSVGHRLIAAPAVRPGTEGDQRADMRLLGASQARASAFEAPAYPTRFIETVEVRLYNEANRLFVLWSAMETEKYDDTLIVRLAHLLLTSSFLAFADDIRSARGENARIHFQAIEYTLARTLFVFWAETEVGRANPDIVAAVARRVRAVLREGRECSCQEAVEGDAAAVETWRKDAALN
jgi:hypothetical protein